VYGYCYSNSHYCDYFENYMEPITIRLKNNLYTIPPQGYMLNNTQIGGVTHKCTIMVGYLSDSQGIYILGDTFLRNFYTTFDLTNNQVQLSVSLNAPKGTRVYSEKPGWQIFLYFLSAVVAFSLFCIAFCFTRRWCSRKWNAP
jgi:hypothetical protein